MGGLNWSIINIFMNAHFQAYGRGTGPLCSLYPHPDKAEANVCFQASSKHPEVRVRIVLPVPFKYSGKCQDKARSGIKTRTICLWAQLIHNWKHTLVAPSLTHISPINSQFCSIHRDGHSSLCTQHTKSAHSSRSQPNPTERTTAACKAQHTPTTLEPT